MKQEQQKSILEVSVDDVEKRKNPSKHYVYVITVTWSDGNINIIYRRYSKFFDFQVKLLDKFPDEAGKINPGNRIIPFLPGKIIFGRSHVREVALKRLDHINKYCKQLIKLPGHISLSDHVISFFEPTVEDLTPSKSGDENKGPVQAKSISEPILLEQYSVIADYTKEAATEISLHAGELVDIIEKNETGWWFVSGEEGQGWVPSSYLERPDGPEETMADQADIDRPHLATHAYDPQFPDEISLQMGAMVEVVERNLDGWWLVKSKEKQGLVPGSYLTRTDTLQAKRLMTAIQNQSQNPSGAFNAHGSYDSSDTEFPEVGASSGSPIVDGRRHKSPSPIPMSSNPCLFAPAQPAFPKQNPSGTKASKGQLKLPVIGGGSKPKLPSHMKFKQDSKGDSTFSSHSNQSTSDSSTVYNKPPPPRRQSVKQLARKASLYPPEKEEEPIYMTVADFTNQAGDGISFIEGMPVEVIEKHDTGWWYVRINGEDGWVPEAYIDKKNPAKQPKQKAIVQYTQVSKPLKSKQNTDEDSGKPKTGNFASQLQQNLLAQRSNHTDIQGSSQDKSQPLGQATNKENMYANDEDDDESGVYQNVDEEVRSKAVVSNVVGGDKYRPPLPAKRENQTKPEVVTRPGNLTNKPAPRNNQPNFTAKSNSSASSVPNISQKPNPAARGNNSAISELSSRFGNNSNDSGSKGAFGPSGLKPVNKPKLPPKVTSDRSNISNNQTVTEPESSAAVNLKALRSKFENR